MNRIPCSVYMITLNCGRWLEQTLESLRDFAEVIILDSGSTDNTYQIAKSFDNVKISHQHWLGYVGQKKLALAQCKYPWALNLDGDEVLSERLKQEIRTCIQDNKLDGLITPINDIFLGMGNNKFTKKHAKVRFFRRSKAHYDASNQVHENIIVQGDVASAKGDICHYGESSIYIKVQKNNHYSELKSKEKFEKNKRPSLVKLICVMPFAFFKSYIIRRSFLNGWRGFVNSMINAFYAFLKEAKLFEKYLKK